MEQPKKPGLNGWVPSTDPFEGRFADVDSEKRSDDVNRQLSDKCNVPYSARVTDLNQC